ncbi:MAG: tRNA pseudouridine(38-40) synthase TruA [Muribaculaceae bacterium]|nr:tRNA pseudouridine(38-40) synthase TruA [Muribaculaceae bacterium]
MRYFLKLSYNGKPFHGWQSQPNAVTVQSVIESALKTIFREEIPVTGAGRTDTGVHARKMLAHFDTDSEITRPERILNSLNNLVGRNIFIESVFPVENDTHARFDATERTYKYFVSFAKNPFLDELCWKSNTHLDMERMNEAAGFLIQTKDFTSFAKLHSDARTNICDVREARWTGISDDIEARKFLGDLNHGIVFTIRADRFLRNMVRAVVGTLVDVGKGKLSVEGFVDIIRRQDRCEAGISMPAKGLFLWDIKYPFEVL